MTIKPMTYLVSFTLFVLMFMGLGGYVAYIKFVEHFMTQSYLDANSINAEIFTDQQGNGLRWDDKIPLQNGASVNIVANNRSLQLMILYSDEPSPRTLPLSLSNEVPIPVDQRIEDIRIGKDSRYLYTRVFSASSIKSKESTWLYKYDLQNRRLLRRASANPVILPAAFRP